MKRNNIFYVCAAAALIFASCQKEGPAPEAPEAADMNVITASSVQTKTTTQDGVNILWEKGDQIKLYTRTWNEGQSKFDASWCDYNTTLDSPSATATFVRDVANTSTVDNTSGKYFAVYRKGSAYLHQSRDYYAQCSLDKELVAKNGGDFVSSIMYAASENSEFHFLHLVSYIKFTVDNNTTPFKKFIVSPVNESELVTSRLKITFSGEEVVTEVLSNNSQDSRTITLTTDNNQNFANGTYYFAVNPGTYTEGLKFTFINEAGENVVITSPANVVMEAGAVANLGTIGTLAFPVPEEPEVPTVLELGKAYANDGVVFWINPDNNKKGKIISGEVANITWGNSSATKYTWSPDINTDNGLANMQYVLNLEGSDAATYPAVYFCKNLGEGWYLPTINEMLDLVRVYYGISSTVDNATLADNYSVSPTTSAEAARFDAEIAKCHVSDPNNAKLAVSSSSAWYWTGQSFIKEGDINHEKCARVKIASTVYVSGGNAKNTGYVRCVREVEIQ